MKSHLAVILSLVHFGELYAFVVSVNNRAKRTKLRTLEADYAEERRRRDRTPAVQEGDNNLLQDSSRRETLTATGALLFTPFMLKELFMPSVDILKTEVASNVVANEALLQGDSIVRTLWLGRISYPVLIVSLECGLFEALKDGPLSKDDLGKRLNPSLRGSGRILEAFVGVLASLNLLQVTNDQRVELTAPARHVLLKDSPYFWGPQLLAADGLTASLRQAMHREKSPAVLKEYSGHSVAAIDSFIDSMQAHGAVTAQATADALANKLSGTKHIVDMAGGSGCFSIALHEKGDYKITLADLPPVVAKFRRQNPFTRIKSVPADLFDATTWPRNADCHLLANVLHDWGETQVYDILRASRSTLDQSTGRLVIVEQLLNDDMSGPLSASLASVSMLLGDWRSGKQYSFADLERILLEVGFSRVERGPDCGDFHTAVIASV